MPFFCGTAPDPFVSAGASRVFRAARRKFATLRPGIATGYWKAMNNPRRERSSASSSRMLSPLNRMSPEVTSYRGCPISVFASVLLPEPFGPIRAWISPVRTVRLTPFRIGFPSTGTWRSLMTRSALLMNAIFHPRGGGMERAIRSPCGFALAFVSVRSGAEALAAGAVVPDVRIVELEPRPHQPVDKIDLGAFEQLKA